MEVSQAVPGITRRKAPSNRVRRHSKYSKKDIGLQIQSQACFMPVELKDVVIELARTFGLH